MLSEFAVRNCSQANRRAPYETRRLRPQNWSLLPSGLSLIPCRQAPGYPMDTGTIIITDAPLEPPATVTEQKVALNLCSPIWTAAI